VPAPLLAFSTAVAFALSATGGPAPARSPEGPPVRRPTGAALAGLYDSPLGRLELRVEGASVVGRLVAPAGACPFAAGEEVLRATLLDDSLAGRLRVWLAGCAAREAWGSVVLLVGPARLTGAVHVAERGCRSPLGRRGGVVLERPSAPPSPRRGGEGASLGRARRERARDLLRDGAAWLSEGRFEAARDRFREAIEIDRDLPEAYNGVGVSYRMRSDLASALGWYKRALAVDPDFGDAYYNMACVYALQGERELALRYLQIAALNGYASAEGIGADPDLASLHGDAAYRALVEAHL
jgi:hypothetical protein